MKSKNRKTYTASFKAKVALTALNELKTLSQVSSMFELSHVQVSKWRSKLKKEAEEVFKDGRGGSGGKSHNCTQKEKELDEAYKQIGKLKVENDWYKKKVDMFAN